MSPPRTSLYDIPVLDAAFGSFSGAATALDKSKKPTSTALVGFPSGLRRDAILGPCRQPRHHLAAGAFSLPLVQAYRLGEGVALAYILSGMIIHLLSSPHHACGPRIFLRDLPVGVGAVYRGGRALRQSVACS